ncbi:MAG TPA: DNA mismatch repair protein MutS [Candidatus Omnitrophota bacterium]|nr:DNA mismatch repair protein MutS [Candidatus Omnitrophota bacterium]
MDNVTPMLKQYQEIKARHQNAILFFRLGDFYEMFLDDARKACGILDVVLTSRDAGKAGRIPMCGIPYHAADTYIAKLIKAGLKVAICEQVEDPALAKGLVKRDVIRIITSGTYIDEASFESRCIICLTIKDKRIGLAFIDTASGAIQANEYAQSTHLIEVLAKLPAAECVFSAQDEELIRALFKNPLLRSKMVALSPAEDWSFNTDIARKSLTGHFQTHNLRGFGIDDMPAAIAASGALLEYLKQVHKQPLRHIHKIALYADQDYVFISPAASYGLELEGLVQVIDHTQTAMGKRLLKDWLYHPLKNIDPVRSRQQAVVLLREDRTAREALHQLLKNIPDIEKSISRISCGTAAARDLLALRITLLKQPEIDHALAALREKTALFALDDCAELRRLLEQAISPEIPLSHFEGKVINKGYNRELDSLRDLQENGRAWLQNLQSQEIKRTGINSLKIGFNQVFGYYIEISKANLDHAPADYIRRQTLANAERFITPALKEFEDKMLTADEKVLQLERALIDEISRIILDNAAALHLFCRQLSTLDCLYSLSVLSLEPGYTVPLVTEHSPILIKEGRHPVVEKAISDPFIANDTLLDCDQNHLMVLTGPNMAGKSTYIRQTAVLVILAQIGSLIPAVSAEIGMVDKIFTRIGAHDEITKGQSTFMVEMSETAGILNNLTERSLVVLDEIGRGTSTFDGLSLAWAISEFLAKAKVRTMFATHFHELTALAEEFPGVKNYNVAVREWNDEVIFLHKIVAGGTDDSYGIYVAKLAGIPREVVQRSRQILTRLELSGDLQETIRKKAPAEDQLSLFQGGDERLLREIKEELEKTDINALTPLQALNKLQKIKERIQDHG